MHAPASLTNLHSSSGTDAPTLPATTPPPRNPRSDLTRRRPRLRTALIAALSAVVLSQLLMTSPAQASHHEAIWTTTLTAADARYNYKGCDETSDTPSARCSQALSSNTFTHDGVTYEIVRLGIRDRLVIQVRVQHIPNSLRSEGVLRLEGHSYSWSSAYFDGSIDVPAGTQNRAQWSGHPSGYPTWTVGQTVTVSLTVPAAQTLPTLDRLPFDDSIEHVPASQRTPTDSGSYCYLGEGNGRTEYIRYSDGRIREVPRQSAAIRSMFGC